MDPAPTATSWRAVAVAAVALWMVPVVLALAVFWLPLLCCAVAAVRFVRVRRKLVANASGRSSSRGCCYNDGDGDRGMEASAMVGDDAGGRLRLLHQYLDDQMELVVGASEEDTTSRNKGSVLQGGQKLVDPTAAKQ